VAVVYDETTLAVVPADVVLVPSTDRAAIALGDPKYLDIGQGEPVVA
jgi:hypothetical protein